MILKHTWKTWVTMFTQAKVVSQLQGPWFFPDFGLLAVYKWTGYNNLAIGVNDCVCVC